MDLQFQNKFSEIFTKFLSPKQDFISQAELELQSMVHLNGFYIQLLHYVNNQEITLSLRQAGSIYLKNLVASSWKRKSKNSPFKNQDRELLRENILEIMSNSHRLILLQFERILFLMISSDFPTRMPQLLPSSIRYIQSESTSQIMTGLLSLKQICKRFSFMSSEKRKTLITVIRASFSVILQLLQKLIEINNEEAAHLIKIICKIYTLTIKVGIPKDLTIPKIFDEWMNCFALILDRNITSDELPQNIYDREGYIWWKCKKRVMTIFTYLFEKYGNLDYVSKGYRKFSEMFINQYSQILLQGCLNLIKFQQEGGWISKAVIQLIISYLDVSIFLDKTYSILRDSIQEIITKTVFPLICFGPEDEDLWVNFPNEYLIQEFNPMDNLMLTKPITTTFLSNLIKQYPEDSLQFTLDFISSILIDSMNNQEQNIEQFIHKDGALLLLQTIAPQIKKGTVYSDKMEDILVEHTFSDFNSNYFFLRARACSIFGEFVDIQWKNQENLIIGCQNVLKCLLNDSEIIVQFHALFCINKIISQNPQISKTIFEDSLSEMIQKILFLNKQISLDGVAEILNLIIFTFGNKVSMHAYELCTQMMETVQNSVNSGKFDDMCLVGTESLKGIATILSVMSENADFYQEISEVLVPFLIPLIREDLFDLAEDIIDIVSLLAYFLPNITHLFFPLIEGLTSIFKFASDLFEEMLPSFNFFIQKSNEELFSVENGKYIKKLLDVAYISISKPKYSTEIARQGCHLLNSIIQHSTSKIIDLIPKFCEILSKRLVSTKNASLVNLLYSSLSSCLWVDAVGTTSTLLKLRIIPIKEFFSVWIRLIREKKIKSIQIKKFTLFGLASLFIFPEKLPTELQDCLKDCFGCLFDLMIQVKTQEMEDLNKTKSKIYKPKNNFEENEKININQDSSDLEFEIMENEQNGNLQNENLTEEDGKKLKGLINQISRFKHKMQSSDDENYDEIDDDNEIESDENYDDDDDSYDEGSENEFLTNSRVDEVSQFKLPLEVIDYVEFVRNCLGSLKDKHLKIYEEFCGGLEPDFKQVLEDIMN
ncbi:d-importin 7/ranbp7 [Anaeramoeba ignava]|uniref:D-importin 7/ranbp7 n=1 Tax=Anaeramoeba ignava TaxID=1746090 RepID=A0A9Q0LCL2_ANAIG|nr:d-importin 7/ranbp7 [Anaeramoeba ignava]